MATPSEEEARLQNEQPCDDDGGDDDIQMLPSQQKPRSPNTLRLFISMQKDFKSWCLSQHWPCGDIVSEKKLCRFLEECVLTRNVRVRRRKEKRRLDEHGKEIIPRLSLGTVRLYVSAITALWMQQKNLNNNPNPTPRGAMTRALIRARRRDEHARKKEENGEHGRRNTTQENGYRPDHVETIIRTCWTGAPKMRDANASTYSSYLRTALDFLLSHTMQLRGETCRNAELPDLLSFDLGKEEGPTQRIALILLLNNGKDINHAEYGVAARHKNTLLCPLAHLSLYLFWRWNITKEPPPNFQHRRNWYDTKTLVGDFKKPQQVLSYETQQRWINQIFENAQLSAFQKMRVGRTNGARKTEQPRVYKGQIRCDGRWSSDCSNSNSLTSDYISSIPREFVQSMAGFEAQNVGNFALPRARTTPPKTLVQAVWPWVDEWRIWYQARQGQAPHPATYEHIRLEPQSDDDDFEDLAGQGFLALLDRLRTILLQDSVIFRREFPDHPLWKEDIFRRDDYLAFASEVEAGLYEFNPLSLQRVAEVFPDLAATIRTTVEDLHRKLQLDQARQLKKIEQLKHKLDDFMAEHVQVEWQARNNSREGMPASYEANTTLAMNATTDDAEMNSIPCGAQCGETSAEGTAVLQPHQQLSYEGAVQNVRPPQVPHYEMSRTITTVHELWREFTVGLQHGIAVENLESAYGARWRRPHKEMTFYSRRKRIVDKIKDKAASFDPPNFSAAVEYYEQLRRREKLSLHRLSEFLRNETVTA